MRYLYIADKIPATVFPSKSFLRQTWTNSQFTIFLHLCLLWWTSHQFLLGEIFHVLSLGYLVSFDIFTIYSMDYLSIKHRGIQFHRGHEPEVFTLRHISTKLTRGKKKVEKQLIEKKWYHAENSLITCRYCPHEKFSVEIPIAWRDSSNLYGYHHHPFFFYNQMHIERYCSMEYWRESPAKCSSNKIEKDERSYLSRFHVIFWWVSSPQREKKTKIHERRIRCVAFKTPLPQIYTEKLCILFEKFYKTWHLMAEEYSLLSNPPITTRDMACNGNILGKK